MTHPGGSYRVSDETLTGQLTELANEWEAVKRGEQPWKDNTLWWLNQTSYAGERFVVALVDDLLAARGLPARSRIPEAI